MSDILNHRIWFAKCEYGNYEGVIDTSEGNLTIMHMGNKDYEIEVGMIKEYRKHGIDIHKDLDWDETCQKLYERYVSSEDFRCDIDKHGIGIVTIIGENITIGEHTIHIEQLDNYMNTFLSGKVAQGILNKVKQV